MKTLMILISAISVLATVPMFLAIPFSAMMFDAPGSMNDNTVWAMFWTVIALPFIIIVLNVIGWVFDNFGKQVTALCFMLTGLVIELVIYGGLAILLRR